MSEHAPMNEAFHNHSTWADVQRAALHDPVLQRLCHVERTGRFTREECLIWAVLWLVKERQRLLDAETQRRMEELPRTKR